jgi:hypothetical protein
MEIKMIQKGFVPPGHARIVPIRVLGAWHHKETGAWLSIQAIGPAMALVWRVCDSWGATPHLAHEICDSLDGKDNYDRACRVAELELNEGPPPDMLASAKRSALERQKKGEAAANARWNQRRRRK